MSEQTNNLGLFSVKNHEQAMDVLKRLFAVAEPGAVYSAPVTVGDQTVITASEVSIGMGLGFGSGSGSSQEGAGGGGGGGGGGGSMGRPVAVIAIGPQGVRVEPVVDPTKIALALSRCLARSLSPGVECARQVANKFYQSRYHLTPDPSPSWRGDLGVRLVVINHPHSQTERKATMTTPAFPTFTDILRDKRPFVPICPLRRCIITRCSTNYWAPKSMSSMRTTSRSVRSRCGAASTLWRICPRRNASAVWSRLRRAITVNRWRMLDRSLACGL